MRVKAVPQSSGCGVLMGAPRSRAGALSRLNTVAIVFRPNECRGLVREDHVQDDAPRQPGVIRRTYALWRRRQPHARGDVVLNLRPFDAVEGDKLVPVGKQINGRNISPGSGRATGSL